MTTVERAATVEEMKASVQRGIGEGFNAANWDINYEAYHPNVLTHIPQFVEPMRSADELIDFYKLLRTAFPDMRLDIQDFVAEGDRCFVHLVVTGTHLGPFFVFPPSGRKFRVEEGAEYRFTGSRISHIWYVPNSLGVLNQIGALPPGDPPKFMAKMMAARARRG